MIFTEGKYYMPEGKNNIPFGKNYLPLEEDRAGRYVGIDFGDSRIGLSISDEKRKIAFPLAVIKRENNSYGFKKMEKLLKEGR